jgi:hypothetical protein
MTPTLTETRTWTATITIGSGPSAETVDASPSEWDTLRETAVAARAEAVEYVRVGLGDEARVTLYKTTKARGTEEDRSGGYVWRETTAPWNIASRAAIGRPVVYVDRQGC